MASQVPSPHGIRTTGWRLSARPSQYLRSAAEQAIEWYPWGDEPFRIARELNRPVLLDIGAAWCHWCHVMDEGTYSDGPVARLLAEHFVAVKVDRDENPEIDRRYQRQVGALSGEGGWPLTAFLTPQGEVFLGGTYFPPEAGMGRPGFRTVLAEVHRAWSENPEGVRENVGAVQESLARSARFTVARSVELEPFVQHVLARIDAGYDPVHAGFGHQPKFPHPTAVSLFLWSAYAHRDDRAGARGLETLRRMAEGGMYDQVGGGFHRYSVDEGWHVPHFEKMAADNAALLSAYVEGARRHPEPLLEETIRGIVGWGLETLLDPGGGFAASQDADNAPGDDGSFFTWSRPEMKAALDPEELRLASRYFGVGTEGRMPHDPDRNVLFRMLPIEEVAAALAIPAESARRLRDAGIAKLRAARGRRPGPIVDRALYSNLNGAWIRGLVEAGRFLGDGIPVATARAAADRFLSSAFDPDRGIAHRIEDGRGHGFGLLDDQVEFGLGLVELAAATLQPGYADAAGRLADIVDREFRGEDDLLKDIAPRLYDGPSIGAVAEASYPLEDNPHLAANSAWALLQIRLGALTGDPRRRDSARTLVRAIAPRIAESGLFAAGAALAAGLLETEPARVVVEGTGPEAERLARAAERSYHPNLFVFRGVPPVPFALPEELASAATAPRGPPRALICFGTRCLAPITDPAGIATALASGGSAPGS